MGDKGWGDQSSAMRSRAAVMAKSIDEDMGVRTFVENHNTVLAMRSA